jgi:hypothetical protein
MLQAWKLYAPTLEKGTNLNKYEIWPDTVYNEDKERVERKGYVILEITPSGKVWEVYQTKWWIVAFLKANRLTKEQAFIDSYTYREPFKVPE